ncbi:copper radical oxidase [Coprinopsis cinerea AmutBmut pab1-1]|nr:copper radical oxidase [Coprinopsis cinerea AmutBmut pab1-1]
MLALPLPLLALSLGFVATTSAVKPGGFEEAGNTLVSAMMMFVGNEEKVYILDKAEGNAAQINNHPAWASVWDLNTRQAEAMDVPSNVFCASGMHLPNGSFATFGGNGAVGPGGQIGSVKNPGGWTASWDSTYQNFDGSRAIRLLDPCGSSDDFNSRKCQWFDDAAVLAMKVPRWYSTAEPLADGTIVMIGGFSTGGYINRDYPNVDPDGPASQNNFEFFPARDDEPPQRLPFLSRTSGLNTYVHAFMMPSGRMFLQANLSTILWNYDDNTETILPDMPKGVVRVYPASGATAMLPLTPKNNYNPTIIFCGGTDMKDEEWGDFAYPYIDTWDYPASKDCQRITPEPEDGRRPEYEQDDDMPEGRTMGQFIILPNGKLLVLNGALNGTAGYAQRTRTIQSLGEMPWGESLAAGPVLTPAIYDPDAPRGKRWSKEGLDASEIPRMYHSSAILLPDGSVLVAGSNPNVDVNLTTIYPTEYRAEVFYPPYFKARVRPTPKGVPSSLSYGGKPFDITIPPSSYSGDANDAAENTIVAVVRSGFTTHAINMGQRFLQLEHTYTVQKDGTIVLHVAQMPPNPNLFQPGPAFLHVTINGIPSNGTYVIVGNGQLGQQPLQPASTLPQSVKLEGVKGASSSSDDSSGLGLGMIIALAAGGLALVLIVMGAIAIVRRRRRANTAPKSTTGGYNVVQPTPNMSAIAVGAGVRDSDSSVFAPYKEGNHSQVWNQSTTSLASYSDFPHVPSSPGGPMSGNGGYQQYPYTPTTPQPSYPYGDQHQQGYAGYQQGQPQRY